MEKLRFAATFLQLPVMRFFFSSLLIAEHFRQETLERFWQEHQQLKS